jgi:retrograde regulation protein 2
VFLVQKKTKDPMKLEAIQDHIHAIEEVGKTKKWIGGRDGWGLAVEGSVRADNIIEKAV